MKNSKKEKKIIIGEITDPDELEDLKKKYTGLKAIVVTDENSGEKHIAYFRKPDRHAYSLAMNLIADDKRFSAGEVLFKKCRIKSVGSDQIDRNVALQGSMKLGCLDLLEVHETETLDL